jgi:hypothetical protein
MKSRPSFVSLLLAFWIGGLIDLLIRRHRKRQLRRVPPPVIPPPGLHDENGLPPWHGNGTPPTIRPKPLWQALT